MTISKQICSHFFNIIFCIHNFLFVLYPSICDATFIGNPSQPSIQKKGLFLDSKHWLSFRTSYFGDYVYQQSFHDEFAIDGYTEKATHVKIWTQAGMFTLNFRNRIDLYGIVGGTKLQIDEEVFTKPQFSWGIGGKLIFLHEGNFRAGCDFKYFQSNQSPDFIQCDNQAYNVTSDFHFNYNEVQAALGLSYTTKYFSPYANASYLVSKIEPTPPVAVVRFPMMNEEVDVITKSVTASNRFGLALGATIIDRKKATLNIEWRTFNQNSVDVSGELRF